MGKNFFLLLPVLLLASCATLFNDPRTRVHIISKTPEVKFYVNNDTSTAHYTPTVLTIKRSNEPLIITIKTDSSDKSIFIKRTLSLAFWSNILYAYGLIGIPVDLLSRKRFSYPHYITIDSTKALGYSRHKPFAPAQKKLLTLNFSVPEGNLFYINRGKSYGSTAGFLGIGVSAEYYISNKYSINADIGTMTDFSVPFPVSSDYPNGYERSWAIYSAVQLGTNYKKWHYAAGLQYTHSLYISDTAFGYRSNSAYDSSYYETPQNNFGFAFSSYYSLTKTIAIGVNYYPSLLAWGADKQFNFHYSHLLFFNLIFRSEAYRPSKKDIIMIKLVKIKTPRRLMNTSFASMLIILLFAGCTTVKPYSCFDATIQPSFIGFSSTEINSIIIRMYKGDDGFNTLLDTFVIAACKPTDTGYCSRTLVVKGDTISLDINRGENFNAYSPGYDCVIRAGFNWSIYIPSTGQTDSISDIVSPQERSSYEERPWGTALQQCTNLITSFKLNGIAQQFTDSTGGNHQGFYSDPHGFLYIHK